MKTAFMLIAFFLMSGLFLHVNSQAADSCSSNLLNLSGQLPFDTTSFNCQPVWGSQSYILRYSQTAPNVWSFVLSAPYTNAYVGMGFSPNGMMIGSSAIVGWVTANGSPMMKRYYLGGQSSNLVVPDQGNLTIVGNSSGIIYVSSIIYMAFQLNTSQPDNQLIYSVGPNGILPVAPGYFLTQHSDEVSISFNYASGQSKTETPYSNLRKTHGIFNMLGWGILIPIGAMVARYLKQWDPMWFYTHTIIQSLGFIFGLAGIICGFVLNNHLNTNVDKHRDLGIFILTLGSLQVFAFLARPGKESKVRKYWNWYHYNVGRILIFFAVVNIFYGIHLGNAGSGWNIGYGIIISILFVVAVVLEVRMWMKKY